MLRSLLDIRQRIRGLPHVEPMTPERKWYSAPGRFLSCCILAFEVENGETEKAGRGSNKQVIVTLLSVMQQQRIDLHEVGLDAVFKLLQEGASPRVRLVELPALVAYVILTSAHAATLHSLLINIIATAVRAENLPAPPAMAPNVQQRKAPPALHALFHRLVRDEEAQMVPILIGSDLLILIPSHQSHVDHLDLV